MLKNDYSNSKTDRSWWTNRLQFFVLKFLLFCILSGIAKAARKSSTWWKGTWSRLLWHVFLLWRKLCVWKIWKCWAGWWCCHFQPMSKNNTFLVKWVVGIVQRNCFGVLKFERSCWAHGVHNSITGDSLVAGIRSMLRCCELRNVHPKSKQVGSGQLSGQPQYMPQKKIP